MTSAQRKLERGIEQAKALYGEATTYENGHAYSLDLQRERRSAQEVKYFCYAVERQAPPPDWPLMLGEIVHNLRCALDHVVWAQVKRPTRRTQFPIFHDPCEYQVKGRPMLAGVKPAVKTLIEESQPFHTLPKAPKRSPLWILHDLWISDKHRELATIAAAVDIPGIAHEGPIEGAELTVDDWGQGKSLQTDAPITTFTVSGPKADKMKVNPYLVYQVRVEGRPLKSTLHGIASAAYRLVNECEIGETFPDTMLAADLRISAIFHGITP